MELQKKWFVYMDDHHEGPFSPDEIYQKQKSGSVKHDSYVWCEGMADWQMLEQVGELKSALQQFKDPAPAKPAQPSAPMAMPKLVPVGKSETTNANRVLPSSASTAALPDSELSPKKSRSFLKLFLTGVITLFVLSVAALAVLSRTATEDTHSLIRPTLAKIVDRVPALSMLFRLTPKIPDIRPEEMADLEQAMIGAPENGVKLAIALSHGDPNRPYFFVATNLPDRTKLDLYLIGNGETLLNRLSFNTQASLTTKFGLGKTDVLLAVGGQPIPRGEYRAYVVEASEQEEPVRDQLSTIQASRVQTKLPPEVPSGTKFLFTGTFFIGGERDETYLTRLKAFHEKVKQSADRELQELKQYTDTLQLQFNSLTTDFAKISKAKKVTPQIKQMWSKTTATWQQINGQMEQSIQTWTKETLQNEFFYGKTYELVKSAYDSIQKLFNLESAYLANTTDKAAFEIAHGKATSEARDALAQLQTRLDAILKSPKTANGLPTREGP